MEILEEYHTSEISNAFEIEHNLHDFFKHERLKGEYFNIVFDDAVKKCIEMIG
jgi:retron-type reverse transcriptase